VIAQVVAPIVLAAGSALAANTSLKYESGRIVARVNRKSLKKDLFRDLPAVVVNTGLPRMAVKAIPKGLFVGLRRVQPTLKSSVDWALKST
jgi:hypothetical protein